MNLRVVEKAKDIPVEIIDYGRNKVQKIVDKLHKDPIDLKLHFSKQHHENVFQIHLILPKAAAINIKTSSFDLTSHIDEACDKLERKLSKHFRDRTGLPRLVDEERNDHDDDNDLMTSVG